jgi:hypothetical protein
VRKKTEAWETLSMDLKNLSEKQFGKYKLVDKTPYHAAGLGALAGASMGASSVGGAVIGAVIGGGVGLMYGGTVAAKDAANKKEK